MNKLELKHLCGYLPYGLKVRMPAINKSTCRRYEIGTVGCLYSDCSIVCHDVVNSTPDWYKPLLLPLSALTEPMEDGSVPIDIIREFNIGYVDFITLERENWIDLYGRKRWIGAIPNMIIEYLHSRHFDIYGLIHAGLAIDKRTLNKTK